MCVHPAEDKDDGDEGDEVGLHAFAHVFHVDAHGFFLEFHELFSVVLVFLHLFLVVFEVAFELLHLCLVRHKFVDDDDEQGHKKGNGNGDGEGGPAKHEAEDAVEKWCEHG